MSKEDSEPTTGLTKESFREIGKAWGGRHWQSDLARETKYSKSHVTRYLTGQRPPTVEFCNALDRVLVDKIEDVANHVRYKGSPHRTEENVLKGLVLIKQGLALLRKTSPHVERAEIESTRTERPGPKSPAVKRMKASKQKGALQNA